MLWTRFSNLTESSCWRHFSGTDQPLVGISANSSHTWERKSPELPRYFFTNAALMKFSTMTYLNFRCFLRIKQKTVTCLMHYDALHYWSKFQNNLSTFQWFTSSWSSSKLYFLLVWKSFICSIFLNKILQHPKINSASAPEGSWSLSVIWIEWIRLLQVNLATLIWALYLNLS